LRDVLTVLGEPLGEQRVFGRHHALFKRFQQSSHALFRFDLLPPDTIEILVPLRIRRIGFLEHGLQQVEEPVALERALAGVPDGTTAVVDCLSLWVANVFESRPVEELSAAAARVAAARPGLTIAVTNEVGLGIVPDNALARAYRDALGRVNAQWAAAAGEAHLVVAGRTLALR